MSGGTYCGGDEVGAIVIDVGSCSTRIGFAGEDVPRADIHSVSGIVDQGDGKKDFIYHWPKLCYPRANMEIQPLTKDGVVEDWESFEQLLDYGYKNVIHGVPEDYPVIISEAAWSRPETRAKMTELFFEKYNVPAFYIERNATLSAFSNCRPTALVLDSGSIHTSAVPVIEGRVLTRSIVRTHLGGDFINIETQKLLKHMGVEIIPSYLVGSKTEVRVGCPAEWTRKHNLPQVKDSFHAFMVKELLKDVAANVLQVSDVPFSAEIANITPKVPYEFPNGANLEFEAERLRITEGLFDPNILQGAMHTGVLGIAQTITTAVNMCDPDLRNSLFSNIQVVGGNSLLNGFVERLTRDLTKMTQGSARVKVHAASGSSERRFAGWIGGSILGSLGTFHQMWISRHEFKEHGAQNILDQKCA